MTTEKLENSLEAIGEKMKALGNELASMVGHRPNSRGEKPKFSCGSLEDCERYTEFGPE
jgi:hypothetical protein